MPKKALESFINTIFQTTGDGVGTNTDLTISDLRRDRAHDVRLANKQLRKGKAHNNKTEPASPTRGRSLTADEAASDPYNKPNSIFLSKTKRGNIANENSLGPGLYNPHENDGLGS